MMHFISYGNDNYKHSKFRIANEARNLGFDTVNIFGPEHLDEEFIQKTTPHLQNPRGAGFWLWKSFILKKILDSVEEGDICVYADAGCHLNINGKQRMSEYIDMIKNHESGFLSFELVGFLERMYTNEKVFEFFNIDLDSKYRDSSQLVGGVLFIRKCEMSMRIINEYYNLAIEQPVLFSDDYNGYKRQPEFRDHRHDQSILGYVRKKYGTVVIPDETFAADFSEIAHVPVIAARIRM